MADAMERQKYFCLCISSQNQSNPGGIKIRIREIVQGLGRFYYFATEIIGSFAACSFIFYKKAVFV